MPSANLDISTIPRETGIFVVTDTSDYTGVTVVSTSLEVTSPEGDSYSVSLYQENFPNLNDEYRISTALLSYPDDSFPDGTYSFVLKAVLSDDTTLVSPTKYLLMDMNVKICWAERYERCLRNNNCFSDEEKEIRTDVRELIQAAEEHFAQFRFALADKSLTWASSLCKKCGCGK